MLNLRPILVDLQTKRAELRKELRGLDAAIKVLTPMAGRTSAGLRPAKHKLSAAARRKMSEGQKARWARFKKQQQSA